MLISVFKLFYVSSFPQQWRMEEAHESESDVEFCEFITYSYFCHLKQTTFVKCTLHIERPPPPTFTFMHGFHLVPHPGGIHEIRHGGVSGTKPIRIHPHWAYNRGKMVYGASVLSIRDLF